MQIKEIIHQLEQWAPPSYQESYDNIGLLTGNPHWECTGILCTLDTIENTIDEAIDKKCNLIVAHHPIIFTGLKKINGSNYIEKTIIKAIKNDIAIYAIHTNLDNIKNGVNDKIAQQLGLIQLQPLLPKSNTLYQFTTYVPTHFAEKAQEALFALGIGQIGNYSECAFTSIGRGSFKPNENAQPHIGYNGQKSIVEETKIECLVPQHIRINSIIQALLSLGYYEEIAYQYSPLNNDNQDVRTGIIGHLPTALTEKDFLQLLKDTFHLSIIKHTQFTQKPIQKVAICGGSGAGFIKQIAHKNIDAYITADVKYHEFFDVNNQYLLADIGHFESEQYTIDLIFDYLSAKFTTFAVLKTQVRTNPVYYF